MLPIIAGVWNFSMGFTVVAHRLALRGGFVEEDLGAGRRGGIVEEAGAEENLGAGRRGG